MAIYYAFAVFVLIYNALYAVHCLKAGRRRAALGAALLFLLSGGALLIFL